MGINLPARKYDLPESVLNVFPQIHKRFLTGNRSELKSTRSKHNSANHKLKKLLMFMILVHIWLWLKEIQKKSY